MSVVQTERPLVTASDSHTQTTVVSRPHNSDTLYFPGSWTFIISVSWPEAVRSLLDVVTTTGRPDGKQRQDGTANIKSLWQAESDKVGLGAVSTFYQCFLSVRFVLQIKERTEIHTFRMSMLIKCGSARTWHCLCVCVHLFGCTVGSV